MSTKTNKCTSCVGCRFLYTEGRGYSNWTWEETVIKCALDRNPNLCGAQEIEAGYDWVKTPEGDNCPATKSSRCDQYHPGKEVNLDVDGEDGPEDYTDDPVAIEAICKHANRNPKGGPAP